MKHITFLVTLALFLSACTNATSPTSTATPTKPAPTATATEAPTATPTATSVPTYDVAVQAFHDYNGNSAQDTDEPFVNGVVVSIGEFSCTTGTDSVDGTCQVSSPAGNHYIKLNTSDAEVQNLDYLFLNNKVVTSVTQQPVSITSKINISLALGQGPLPAPLSKSSYSHIIKGFGAKNDDGSYHWAIDYRIVGNKPQVFYANISGTVEKIPDSTPEQPFGPCGLVNIIHRSQVGSFNVGIGHLTKIYVTPGQQIQFGTPVGEIDSALYAANIIGYEGDIPNYAGRNLAACTNNPHLEYYVYGPGGVGGDGNWGWLDPALFSPRIGILVPMN